MGAHQTFGKRIMNMKLRSLGHALFTASLLLVNSQKAHSEVESTPKKEKEFFLSGSAYQDKDGTITVYIVNNAPDGSVYLISNGEIDSPSYDKEGASHIISGQVISVIGDPSLHVVCATAPKARGFAVMECFSTKIKIPQEYKDRQIDFVDVTVRLCKTPIATKYIPLQSCSVRLPVKPRK